MKPTSSRRLLASSTASGWLARGTGFVASLITLPLVVGALGKTEYGIWVLIGQLTGFMGLSDLGVSNAVGRFVARCRSGDGLNLGAVIGSSTRLLLGAGVITIGLVLLGTPWVADLLDVPAPQRTQATVAFLLTGLAVGLRFPLRTGQGVLAGYQRYPVINVIKTIGVLATVLAIVVLAVLNRLTLVSLAIVVAAAGVAEQLVLFAVARRGLPPGTGVTAPADAATVRGILSLGTSALGMSGGATLYRQGLALAVGLIIGLEAAGLYGVALTIMTYVSALATEVHRPLLTLASEWDATGDLARVRRATNLVMRFSFALGLCIAAGVFVYGEPILRLLLGGTEWTEEDFLVVRNTLTLMSLCLAVGLPQMASRSVLQGVGLHWAATNRYLLAALIALALGSAAMASGAGILGAAAGWGLVWVLQGTVFYPPLIARHLQQGIGAMIASAYLPGLAVGLLTFGVTSGAAAVLDPTTILPLLAGIALSLAAGGGALLLLVWNDILPVEAR